MVFTLAPTPKDEIFREGSARLYRFRGAPERGGPPVLLVPSLINRWYVLDLRPGASLAGALAPALPVYCLDWGAPEDEDRYLGWDAILAKLSSAVRRVLRDAGATKVALLGYCMGGTLAAIQAALEPERTQALINLAGPIDFSQAGALGRFVDPRWFDAQAVADAGNVRPEQMQSGFLALQPMLPWQKLMGYATAALEPEAREPFLALEAWANDNTAFPGAAYATYIRELYQENRLVRGEHAVGGRRVDLAQIRCPVLTVVASRDVICPPAAATALNARVSSATEQVLQLRGGHVGAVVGQRAREELYPALVRFILSTSKASPVALAPEAVM